MAFGFLKFMMGLAGRGTARKIWGPRWGRREDGSGWQWVAVDGGVLLPLQQGRKERVDGWMGRWVDG